VNKAKLNYWADVIIGVSFVLSAVSGLIFLLPVGSTSALSSGVLGISYSAWDSLHTWSSLTMIGGILAHLVLHWKWIVGMTRKTLLPARNPRMQTASAPGTNRNVVTRRQFLSFGLAAILTGALAVGCSVLTGGRTADAEQKDATPDPGNVEPTGSDDPPTDAPAQPVQQQGNSTPDPGSSEPTSNSDPPTDEPEQPVQQQSGVACPRGTVNDPYPGRCRLYTDRDGNGFCDYSVPGSGNN
jgi:hypothetical protein